MNIEKKYQVFVSSTFIDLQEERQEVIKALLELDCFPSSMEFFPSTDDDQWTLIKQIIDDCDYYIVIIGGRYGSLSSEGISYTEKEYRYALETGKPIIGFLHSDPKSLPVKNSELDPEAIKKLEAFKELVQKKMCKYWNNAVELGSVVSRSFIKLQKSHPAIGWVRGNLVPEKDSSIEILELTREIEKLKQQIEDTKTKAPKGSEELAQGYDEIILNYTCESNDGTKYDFESTHSWKGIINTTWNDVFAQIAPHLISEINEHQIKNTLNKFIEKLGTEKLEKQDDAKVHKFKSFVINKDDYQTIKVQLRALGLITQSVQKRAVSDKGTYWTLTPYGDTVMNQLRAIQRDEQ
jgi:ribosomal protein L30E